MVRPNEPASGRGFSGAPQQAAASAAARRLASLNRLRERAARRDEPLAAAPRFAGLQRQLAKQAKQMGAAGEAWAAVCPSEIVARTKVVGLLRGELRVGVANDADRFALDRFLRSGGERMLIETSPTPVRRVRLCRVPASELAAPHDEEGDPS